MFLQQKGRIFLTSQCRSFSSRYFDLMTEKIPICVIYCNYYKYVLIVVSIWHILLLFIFLKWMGAATRASTV